MTEESIEMLPKRKTESVVAGGEYSEQEETAGQREQKETKNEKAEEKYNEILSKVSVSSQTISTDDTIRTDAKSIGELTDEEGKVQKLLDLAAAKGVLHAVRVARSLGDYYALDRMHDDLADKLYDGLVARGLLEKE